MAQTSDPGDQNLKPGSPPDIILNELAAQLGVSDADAEIAWNAVCEASEAGEADGAAGAEQPDGAVAERLNVGDLIDLFDGGKKPDLVEMAKDEMVKAVAEKLGVDPEKAASAVDTILAALEKPAPKRRKTTRKKPKKKTPRKRPSAASGRKKRPKAKPSSTAKPTPRKKRPAAKPAGSTTAKPRPKKKRPAAKPKPASGSSTSKPRKRRTTRSGAAGAGSAQAGP
jgi:nucleoid DNA-binding protein